LAEFSKDDLLKLQDEHVSFLEDIDQFIVSGVPILRCFNYKTIQIINNIGLKAMMEADKGKDET
jgi:hypothetical protein